MEATCVHWCINRETGPWIHNKILYSIKKEKPAIICNNIDRLWGHYAKWIKSDWERQTLYDFTCMWKESGQSHKCPVRR